MKFPYSDLHYRDYQQHRVAQKIKPLTNYQKIMLNRHINEMIKHYNILCVTYFLASITMT